jgi:hypothetical protein
MGLTGAIGKLFAIDPVLLVLTIAGACYMALRKRNLFILLWFIPFLIFNLVIGFVSYWYLIPLLPAFCICSAVLIRDTSKFVRKLELKTIMPYGILAGIAVYGLIITSMLITLDLTSFHFQVISSIAANIQNTNTASSIDTPYRNDTRSGMTVLGSNYWLWIPKYVFDKNDLNEYRNYFDSKDNMTGKFLLVVGENFKRDMMRLNDTEYNEVRLAQLLDRSKLLTTIEDIRPKTIKTDMYPFNSLTDLDLKSSTKIEIRKSP